MFPNCFLTIYGFCTKSKLGSCMFFVSQKSIRGKRQTIYVFCTKTKVGSKPSMFFVQKPNWILNVFCQLKSIHGKRQTIFVFCRKKQTWILNGFCQLKSIYGFCTKTKLDLEWILSVKIHSWKNDKPSMFFVQKPSWILNGFC